MRDRGNVKIELITEAHPSTFTHFHVQGMSSINSSTCSPTPKAAPLPTCMGSETAPHQTKGLAARRSPPLYFLYQFLVQDSPKAGLDLEVVNARETIRLAR